MPRSLEARQALANLQTPKVEQRSTNYSVLDVSLNSLVPDSLKEYLDNSKKKLTLIDILYENISCVVSECGISYETTLDITGGLIQEKWPFSVAVGVVKAAEAENSGDDDDDDEEQTQDVPYTVELGQKVVTFNSEKDVVSFLQSLIIKKLSKKRAERLEAARLRTESSKIKRTRRSKKS